MKISQFAVIRTIHKVGYLLCILFFCAAFFTYCFTLGTRMREGVKTVEITFETNGEKVVCGGIECDGAILTVAHIFRSSADEGTEEHRNGLTYLQMANCLYVHMNERAYPLDEAYVDEQSDVALLPCKNAKGKILFRDQTTFFTSLYLRPAKDAKYRRTDLLFLSPPTKGDTFCLSGVVEKGSSGYPVLDRSGYVTAIIHSVDREKNVTYATGATTVRKLYESFLSMCK